MPDFAVITIDPSGLIIGWDTRAESIYGYNVNEITGKPIALLYTFEAVKLHEPHTNLELALLNTTHHYNNTRQNKNGTKFDVAATCTAIFGADHQLLAYSEVSHMPDAAPNRFERGDIHFGKLIENSHEGITLVDAELNVVYRSRAAERISGWNTQDRIKTDLLKSIHPEDAALVNQLIGELKRAPGTTTNCSFRMQHFNGNYIWVGCGVTNYLDDPDLGVIVINFRDITTEKTAVQQLRLSESKFKALVENGTDGVSIFDANRKPTYLSPGFKRILGYKEEETSQLHFADLIHPDDLGYTGTKLKESLENPTLPIKNIFYRMKHRDGSWIWIEATLTNFIDDPAIGGIVNNFRDVTANRLAQEKIIESANFIKTVTDNVPALIAYWTADLRCLFANQPHLAWFDKELKEMQGISKQDLLGPKEFKLHESHIAQVLKGNEQSFERFFSNKKGKKIYTHTQYIPDTDGGVVKGFYSLVYDITERKLSQEKILESANFIKTVTDNLPALIAYWTADLRCLFANKAHLHWFDKKLSEMQGISKRELLGEDEFKLHETEIKHVLAGEPQRFEREFINNRGDKLYTHTQYIPDTDGGVVKGFYSIIYDITEIKMAEQLIHKKSAQIEELLENITDGFIALDEKLCYTYANKKIGQMLTLPVESLIGKNIWDVFPDAVGSATYQAIQNSFENKTYTCNEDYYAPFDLWQENRVYPSENGVSVFIRDITTRKREELQLRLFESAIKHSRDAVMITTEAQTNNDQGARILYINDAFTKMTGYGRDEIIGKTPAVLQGPKSDKAELKRLGEAIRAGQTCEVTIVNYRKNGEEFWINFAVSPVTDEKGKVTHLIAIERDVTERKTDELQQKLMADIGLVFNDPTELKPTLERVLQMLIEFGNFNIAEAWLINADKKKIGLAAKFAEKKIFDAFYAGSATIKEFVKGEGLPGITWKSQRTQFWPNIDKDERFLRKNYAKKAGLKAAYGVPLLYNGEIIGVLVLGANNDLEPNATWLKLFDKISAQFGAEIKRKQLEQELNQVFNLAPDIICIAGEDGYFKKINPAMCKILEYSELELLSRPYLEFVYPDDRIITNVVVEEMVDSGERSNYFENRYITQSGKIKWLAWAGTPVSEAGLIFCVAKDITDKKDLEALLNKATTLARIGGWEIDMVSGVVNWSPMAKEIHEVEPDFEPDLDSASGFFKAGADRLIIKQKVKEAFEKGTPYDVELQIVTAKGNDRWVRVIGEAKFSGDRCLMIYGSFQDIDARKKAERAVTEALEERNTILESIGDAFFAVDENWTVTYWNSMAEKMFKTPKSQILHRTLVSQFSYWKGSFSHQKYLQAISTNEIVHYEHYSEQLNAWLESSIFPADNGLTVYVKDITSRKNAEAAATDILEERNTILESIGDAFFAVDANWTVTYWNNMAEKVLSKTKAEVLQHNLWDVFSESVGSESYKQYHEAMATNQARHFEDHYPPLNKWYEISAYPSVNGLSVYFKDVTERKLAEIQLQNLNIDLQKQTKELAISNAELEQFAFVASHDLQEPLRMVTSFLTQIEKKYGDIIDEKGKQYIHFAVDGAKRMRQIILDLLEFSKVKSIENDKEDVDLNKLIGEITALYRKQIEETGANIVVENLPTLAIYKTPMRQVFQNLISNSLKYHNQNVTPTIAISCIEKKDRWQFSVNDNGIGIESEYFDKIFIIFQRLHNKDDYSGTGMGLAVTKKIIENLGGRIWVESEIGAGSTFYFTLLKK